jgi:hypothetical protein
MNLIRGLAAVGDDVEIVPVLPRRCGYEEMAQSCGLSPIWFDQGGSRIKRLLFDTVALPRLVRQARVDAVLSLGRLQ